MFYILLSSPIHGELYSIYWLERSIVTGSDEIPRELIWWIAFSPNYTSICLIQLENLPN